MKPKRKNGEIQIAVRGNKKPAAKSRSIEVQKPGNAEVYYAEGRTVSSEREFEFIRVDVGMTVPCEPEHLVMVLAATKKTVQEELKKAVSEALQNAID